MPHAMLIDIAHRSFEETLARCAELGGGVDLIFTSPPYPTAHGTPTRSYGGDAPRHFLWPDYQRLGDYCFRALRPGGFCIVIIDGPVRDERGVGSERNLIAFEMAVDWARRVGFRYVEHEAYVRDGMPGRFHPRRRSGWEPMHLFQRPGGSAWFDAWACARPATTEGRSSLNGTHKKAAGRVRSGRVGLPKFTQGALRCLTTAITARRIGANIGKPTSFREHPAPFTEDIAEAQVLGYSPPGSLVCDPFNGSGTTGIVAARHGRGFIGGDLGAREKDGRRWADIGRERAEEAATEFAAQVHETGKSSPASVTVRAVTQQGSLFK